MRRVGNAVFLLMVAAVIVVVAQPDVRLRWKAGEVVGWVSVTKSSDSEGHVSYRARVEPLVYSRTAPREFTRFSSGVAGRLQAACRSRGVDPVARRFPDLPEAMRQPASQAFGRMGIDPSPVTWGRWQILCRLRYAGLFRRVVYDFEELRPEDEARLRQELGGGQFPGGPARRPAPGSVPRR